jgi:histidinol phosphatase-like PHP family hydrolase
MIDLHTHTFFSDGALVPSELARRAEARGLRALAFTDHADASNLEFLIAALSKARDSINRSMNIKVLVGIELTHVPPSQIAELIKKARDLGAQLVIVHGQTIVEPVAEGTNRAAIEAGCDILAHPGLIDEDDVRLAAQKGVALEISSRQGNCLTNGHVARLALQHKAELVLNSDAHAPSDLIDLDFARQVAAGAGIDSATFELMLKTSARLAGLE